MEPLGSRGARGVVEGVPEQQWAVMTHEEEATRTSLVLAPPNWQGPNLMVAFGLPPPVAAAAALSSTIEHSGQCTALRVLLAPGATEEAVQGMFSSTVHGQDAPEYLRAGTFAGLLEPPPTTGTGGDTPPGV